MYNSLPGLLNKVCPGTKLNNVLLLVISRILDIIHEFLVYLVPGKLRHALVPNFTILHSCVRFYAEYFLQRMQEPDLEPVELQSEPRILPGILSEILI